MPQVRTVSHDHKVFFRRLLVPAELQRTTGAVISAAELAGLTQFNAAINATVTGTAANLPGVTNLTELSAAQASQFAQVSSQLFANYQPAQFRGDVIAKANTVAAQFRQSAIDKTNLLVAANAKIAILQAQIAALSQPTQPSQPGQPTAVLDTATAMRLAQDQIYYAQTVQLPEEFAAANANAITTAPESPREQDIASGRFVGTQAAISTIQGMPNLTATELNLANEVYATLNVLLSTDVTPTDEAGYRQLLSDDIAQILNMMTPGASNVQALVGLKNDLSLTQQLANTLTLDIKLVAQTSQLRPFYEPVLLDALIGPMTVTTSMNRMGQPGSATVVFHLPIDSGGGVPALFMGIKSTDIFSLDLLEGQSSVKTANVRGSAIPAQTLPILQANLRETNFKPFDMIQIWGHRRYNSGSNFPGDYSPTFTGFITKITTSYQDGVITVTVQAEDVGKVLRLARVPVDPDMDLRFNIDGIDPKKLSVTLAGFQNGSQLIQTLIQGGAGTFTGLSNVEVIAKTSEPAAGAQTMAQFSTSVPAQAGRNAFLVSLAADFENIKLNLWSDLLSAWPPYAKQFLQFSAMWSTDAKTKWEICREIADVTEFEFYADTLGVINYHPPLYFLNPFDAQYLIEDVEINSESHMVDEAAIQTVMEVNSDPGMDMRNPLNIAHALDVIVPAPDYMTQRYGVRWMRKTAPIFAGLAPDPKVARLAESGRTGYARALLNRRNAQFRSATVTINGCPEIRLCNTVALVGNLTDTLQKVATQSILAFAGGILGQASSLIGSLQGVTPGAIAAMSNIMVYYVSGVTHNYNQGGEYTTTLTLTHGRRWTDPVNEGTVGYALDANSTNAIVDAMRAAFGQENWPNATEFATFVNNKIQYLATGNPTFLTRPTDSPFGLFPKAPKPSLLSKLRLPTAAQIEGFLSKAICRLLTSAEDPFLHHDRIAHQHSFADDLLKGLDKLWQKLYQNVIQPIIDFLTGKKNVTTKLLKKLTDFINNLIKKEEQKLANFINQEEAKLFDAFFGKDTFKILVSLTFDEATKITGVDIKKLTTIPGLGPLSIGGIGLPDLSLSRVIQFHGGIALYVWGGISRVSAKALLQQAEQQLRAKALHDLNPQNPSQIVVLVDQHITSLTVSIPQVQAPGSPAPAPNTAYYGFGLMIVGAKLSCI